MHKEENDIVAGRIIKTATVENQTITDADLKLINKYALEPLKAEDVFTFKVIMGDNETDDRNYEPFNLKALQDLKKLYPGKPMIFAHDRTSKQVARIYDADIVQTAKTTKSGELYTQLIGKAYMVKTDSNADLIAEIKAGIIREVSTSTSATKAICNICGVDNVKSYCVHWPGRTYDKDGKKKTCMMIIDGCKEAYELSFVTVPAQPRAGTYKAFGSSVKYCDDDNAEDKLDSSENEKKAETEKLKKEIALKMEIAEEYLAIEKEEEEEHE